jgi:hypothetical protein
MSVHSDRDRDRDRDNKVGSARNLLERNNKRTRWTK